MDPKQISASSSTLPSYMSSLRAASTDELSEAVKELESSMDKGLSQEAQRIVGKYADQGIWLTSEELKKAFMKDVGTTSGMDVSSASSTTTDLDEQKKVKKWWNFGK